MFTFVVVYTEDRIWFIEEVDGKVITKTEEPIVVTNKGKLEYAFLEAGTLQDARIKAQEILENSVVNSSTQ